MLIDRWVGRDTHTNKQQMVQVCDSFMKTQGMHGLRTDRHTDRRMDGGTGSTLESHVHGHVLFIKAS